MSDAPLLTDDLLQRDPGAFRATVRLFRTTGLSLEALDDRLRKQGAGPHTRLEARLQWLRPGSYQALAQVLHQATSTDLYHAVPEACRRHHLNPLSIVALETLRPLALGRSLGLPDDLIRSMPGKRRSHIGVGLWHPDPGTVRPEPFRDLALQHLALVDQPDLEALPDGLRVAETILLDRLPRLERLGNVLQTFRGDLRIRCGGPMRDLPRDLNLHLLRIEGQGWVELPLDHVKAPRVELRQMPRLESLPGYFEVQHLEVGLCPALRQVAPLPSLVPAPSPNPRDLREGRAFRGYGLTLQHCPSLTSLPEGFRVPGLLTIRDCPALSELPPDLEAWSLELTRLPTLRRLPEGLHVRGTLTLESLAALESLPAGLRVEGDLILRGLHRHLPPPADLEVGGRVRLHPAWMTPAWRRFKLAPPPFGTLP